MLLYPFIIQDEASVLRGVWSLEAEHVVAQPGRSRAAWHEVAVLGCPLWPSSPASAERSLDKGGITFGSELAF